MIVILVNGYPESGKDEVIQITDKLWNVYQHSSIDTPKEVAYRMGWDGEKNDKNRSMLVDLKQWWIKYFDGPFKEITELIDRTKALNIFDFLFTQSREGEEIQRIKDWCESQEIGFVYLFVRREGQERDYNNESDNNVSKGVTPDYYINNNGTLDELKVEVTTLMSKIKLME